MTRNLETTQAIYQAFGKGDVPFILEKVSDHVKWESWADNEAVKSGKVPYLKTRSGKAGVGEFFASLVAVEMHDFQVHGFMEGGNQVVASVTIEFTVKSTGKRLRDEELHLWTYDDAGQVIALRHYVDTAKHLRVNS
jgi:ketosteroid isomerase-like protein